MLGVVVKCNKLNHKKEVRLSVFYDRVTTELTIKKPLFIMEYKPNVEVSVTGEKTR